MDYSLEVRIDGIVVAPAQVEAWERQRAKAVLRKLRRMLKLEAAALPDPDDLAALRSELLRLKDQLGRQGLRDALQSQLGLSAFTTKLGILFSGRRRKQCVTEIRVSGCTARQISEAVDDLMRNDTAANRQSNLQACPDHYVLEPRGDVLEVIETTGGSPLPAQFFMRFEDESGLLAPRNPAYAYQSVGTARLGDGTVIGGVRHQFRDEGDGAVARLMVEFPAATPQHMIREHQRHLACEFSHWLREAISRAGRAP